MEKIHVVAVQSICMGSMKTGSLDLSKAAVNAFMPSHIIEHLTDEDLAGIETTEEMTLTASKIEQYLGDLGGFDRKRQAHLPLHFMRLGVLSTIVKREQTCRFMEFVQLRKQKVSPKHFLESSIHEG